MATLKILGIILIISYIIMLSVMIIFERDKPKHIIIWSILFLFTQYIGYYIFVIDRILLSEKKKSIYEKAKQDEIYSGLSSNFLNVNESKSDDEILNFNKLAYNSKIYAGSNFEVIGDYDRFKELIVKDITSAESYVYAEINNIFALDIELLKDLITEKIKSGVKIKIVYGGKRNHKVIKTLKELEVRVCRFNKLETLSNTYKNIRNIISIDGKTAYLGQFLYRFKNLKEGQEMAISFLRVRGDIVQDINLELHKDLVFGTNKHIDYSQNLDSFTNQNTSQFVVNNNNVDLELMLTKAICSAKKSIQLELETFIPTESLISLIKFAINSNIEIKLMVPLKAYKFGKYFASRAYAKELALLGANVYLYDGYINFNSIVVDSTYCLFGSFVIDREFINNNLQDILITKDPKIINSFERLFDKNINNSYRINDAKYMLIREKFFKNFV